MTAIAKRRFGADEAEAGPAHGNTSLLLFESLPNLAGVPDIFAALTEHESKQVMAAGESIRFAPGDLLFRQGDPHRGIFILRDGIVRSLYSAPNGREITLANWTPGNFVGGPDIFGEAPHVWSGVGVKSGEAIRLPGPVVRRLMSEIPNFAIGLVQGLAYKGKCYSSLLQMLGTRSVVERLALLLLNLTTLKGVESENAIVIADMPSHEELAAMVGATRQWVSINIEKFRKRGLIDVGDRRLVILRHDALRAIAGC
ncbi:MAG TPA: Crp/Fnr family transcriptional regulator [Methylovirgula sp.]